MDIGLPDMTGHEATERILAEHPSTRIVMVTMFDDDESVRLALVAGAIGYVVKDSQPEQIIAAEQAAAMGASLFGCGFPGTIHPRDSASAPTALSTAPFTRSERRVARFLMKGLPNTAIAECLGVSPKTVASLRLVGAVEARSGPPAGRDSAAPWL